MALGYPLINGFRHAWSSVEFRIASNLALGITKVDYADNTDRTEVRATGSRVVGFTQGNASAVGSFTMLLEEFNGILVPSLLELAPTVKAAFFDIIVSYDESGSGLSTIVDTIEGCVIKNVKIGTTEAGNTDPSLREIELNVMRVLWNGIDFNPPQPLAI